MELDAAAGLGSARQGAVQLQCRDLEAATALQRNALPRPSHVVRMVIEDIARDDAVAARLRVDRVEQPALKDIAFDHDAPGPSQVDVVLLTGDDVPAYSQEARLLPDSRTMA